jgi:tRNA dimethylallyltransferase
MAAPVPLLVVAGPTASGKSGLALEVAGIVGGEIVSADAFAIYRGLDIGTDKPSPEARRQVPHHLIDIIDPNQRFSAGDFAAAADRAITEIRERRRVPMVVGGSHFYIRALLLGLFPAPPRDPVVRARLAEEWERDAEGVHRWLATIDPAAARRIASADRQRVLRALEVWELTGVPISSHWQSHHTPPRYRPLLVTPQRSRDDLYARINSRVDIMFASGLVDEVSSLLRAGVPRDAHALKAIGYREVVAHLDGHITLRDAIEQTKQSSRRFAKRQLSWLRHLREGELHRVAAEAGDGADQVARLWREHREGSEGP